MDVDRRRRLAMPDQPIAIEVPFDGASLVDRDFPVKRCPRPSMMPPCACASTPEPLHDDAAVQRAGDLVHADGPRGGPVASIHGQLHDLRAVASRTCSAWPDRGRVLPAD